MALKIGLFGAEHGTPVDIPDEHAPIKLIKLEAWTDDTQKIISGIQFTYNFDTAQDPEDYVVNLYGYADTNGVHKLGIQSHAGGDNWCGEETGNSFKIPVASGSIVAFFGLLNGGALKAVGAYAVPE